MDKKTRSSSSLGGLQSGLQKHPVQVKALQKRSREESTRRGTSGRSEHKGKARATNKPYGGKMAM